MERRVLLLILDGAGYHPSAYGNAVTAAHLPHLFAAMERRGFAVLGAAEESVGLEAGQVGNSEAGHLTIGAGRVVASMARHIDESSRDGSWLENPGWQFAVDAGVLHLTGLLSDAGVHGLARTVVQAASIARQAGVPQVWIHPVLDGVDALAGTAPECMNSLQQNVDAMAGVGLGVVLGRQWFCDRSGNLDVSRVAADALCGRQELPIYAAPLLQQHIASCGSEANFPAHLAENGRFVRPGEPVLVSNHRADRVRQILQVLCESQPALALVDPGQGIPVTHVFFPQNPLSDGLAFEFRKHDLRSVRIAEKCKFPHVTYFFNGFDTSVEGEGRCIPSILEQEIAVHPEMSLRQVTDTILEALLQDDTRVVVANLANLDQVGHLGRFDLATRAAQLVDEAFDQIATACEASGFTLMVTADHGNADRTLDDDGKPFGSHTDRPVPFVVCPAPGLDMEWLCREGALTNVAATCLAALDLEIPRKMSPPLVRFLPAA